MYKGIVRATVPEAEEGQQAVSIKMDVPETLAEAVKVMGSEQVILDLALQMFKIQKQNTLRREHRVKLGLVESKSGGSKQKGIERA